MLIPIRTPGDLLVNLGALVLGLVSFPSVVVLTAILIVVALL